MFKEGADLATVAPMTITDSEKVTVFEAQYVRVGQICVLVLLHGVVLGDAPLCREGKLRHYV